MVHVIATIEVAVGRRSDLLAEFAKLVPLVRAEVGCIEYTATVDVPTTIPVQVAPRPDVMVVVEKWASLDALYAHLQAPHMLEYRQRAAGMVGKVSLQILQPA